MGARQPSDSSVNRFHLLPVPICTLQLLPFSELTNNWDCTLPTPEKNKQKTLDTRILPGDVIGQNGCLSPPEAPSDKHGQGWSLLQININSTSILEGEMVTAHPAGKREKQYRPPEKQPDLSHVTHSPRNKFPQPATQYVYILVFVLKDHQKHGREWICTEFTTAVSIKNSETLEKTWMVHSG